MRAAAPPGQSHLDLPTRARLSDLTRSLVRANPGAVAEHERFLAIAARSLDLPGAELTSRLRGTTILVTGGTGCIGSTLLAELAGHDPARLVSVSRGVAAGWPRQEHAEYRQLDIRDSVRLTRLVAEVRPDVIFHIAAQRDPGLAEAEVHRTLSTNVLGTRNVLAAAASAGVRQVVYASTGKALRPYSPDMYTASKRAAEWICFEAAVNGGMLCSAARFTHVIDNSLIYRRLRGWAGDPDATIRLHSPDIAFYAQSALESAQLLLLAFLGARPGELRVHAITDLGWPVCLLDLALSVLAHADGPPPVYFSGYDAGYEEVPFPALYDPVTAGDVSPLMNLFETAAATDSPAPQVDAFRLELARDHRLSALLAALAAQCDRTRAPAALRHGMNQLSWALLDSALRAASPAALARAAVLAKAHWDTMGQDHHQVLEMITILAGQP
ncbi:MAG TPA: polysaccharide biosynthesis protein [Trebonia sp.]|nr:polysaccharide biosynthesis protein [Trebonia sp.]